MLSRHDARRLAEELVNLMPGTFEKAITKAARKVAEDIAATNKLTSERLLTVKEAAQLGKVSEYTIRERVRAGKYPAIQDGPGCMIRIPESAILQIDRGLLRI